MPGGWGGGGWGGGGFGAGTLAPDLDLSFEESAGNSPYALPGGAQGWIVTVIATAYDIAAFTYPFAPPSGEETFDGWVPGYLFAFPTDPSAVQVAGFSALVYPSPQPFESFEAGWGNAPYITTGDGFELGQFGTDVSGRTNFESFETQWSNVPYAHTLDDVTTADLLFAGAGPVETFDLGWQVSPYVYRFELVAENPFVFNGLFAILGEDFEHTRQDALCSIASDGTVSCTAHGLIANMVVIFTPQDGATLPPGVVQGVSYLVAGTVTTNTFQFALPGGGVIAPGAASSGPILCADPVEFWDTFTVTI